MKVAGVSSEELPQGPARGLAGGAPGDAASHLSLLHCVDVAHQFRNPVQPSSCAHFFPLFSACCDLSPQF